MSAVAYALAVRVWRRASDELARRDPLLLAMASDT